VAPEKLNRESVIEQALALASDDGLEAVTIRRLAARLGVTPMALYWHFKSKDELLLALCEHVLASVTADLRPEQTWNERLRAMVEALTRALRAYPSLCDLLPSIHKEEIESFRRATNAALDVLVAAGFTLQEGFHVASYLLNGVVALVQNQPDCDLSLSREEQAEVQRRKRLELESLPADRYPRMVEYAATLVGPPDVERYFTFGTDLLLAGVERMAERATRL
jgi:AcrR family transcriptional regulator